MMGLASNICTEINKIIDNIPFDGSAKDKANQAIGKANEIIGKMRAIVEAMNIINRKIKAIKAEDGDLSSIKNVLEQIFAAIMTGDSSKMSLSASNCSDIMKDILLELKRNFDANNLDANMPNDIKNGNDKQKSGFQGASKIVYEFTNKVIDVVDKGTNIAKDVNQVISMAITDVNAN
jgi:hypothetical protein